VNTLAARGVAGFTQDVEALEEHAPQAQRAAEELGATGGFLAGTRCRITARSFTWTALPDHGM